MSTNTQRVWGNVAAIAVIVIAGCAAYWPVRNNDFINIDDPIYISSNPHVTQGLTAADIRWAFTTDYAANWHPLTWLSHMLDCDLWGVNAPRFHETNVILHIIDACLVYALVRLMGGSARRSAIVGAIFALHPVHVESVAWAAERKDVLAALFGLLSLCCYIRYARATRRLAWYLLTFFTLVLGLLAKPTVVTLPFVFLLLDYWPLNRMFVLIPATGRRQKQSPQRVRLQSRVLFEKIPFLLLSLGSCVMTFLAQRHGGAVASVGNWPIQERLANVMVGYLRYVGLAVWPVNLAAYYPLSGGGWPDWLVFIASTVVIIISALVILWRRRYPYLAVGWLWFLGMLVPEIGLVQVGGQSIADRYMYLPSIGLVIGAAWLAAALSSSIILRRSFVACAIAACVALGVLTWRQVGFWKNPQTLLSHTLAVVPDNAFCHFFLGADAAINSHSDEAISNFTRAIQLQPEYAPPYIGIGRMLMIMGRFDEAQNWFSKAEKLRPNDSWIYWNYGDLNGLRNNWKAAAQAYQHSLDLAPDEPIVIQNLAMVLIQAGEFPQAEAALQRLVQLQPDAMAHHYLLAIVLYRNAQMDAAEKELALVAQNASPIAAPQIEWQLAMLDLRSGKIDHAIPHLRRAAELNPNLAPALQNLAWILATHPDPKIRNSAEAVHLAERAADLSEHKIPEILDTLAAAYAANAQFAQAITTIQQAVTLASGAGKTALAAEFTNRLKLYQAGKAFIDQSLVPKS